MLKKIKLHNSTILFIGILIIFLGICIGFYDYFLERKNNVYSEMNILLFENESPQNIEEENQDNNELIISEESQEQENDNQSTVPQEKYIGVLEIPKINLKRGFFGLDSKLNHVDSNITVIKGSTFPEEDNNNLILAAHSGRCSVCFFDNLYKLSEGDKAYLDYNNKKYSYKIVNIYNVDKDGTVEIYRDSTKKTLTLITCTRNSDNQQTVYILELID